MKFLAFFCFSTVLLVYGETTGETTGETDAPISDEDTIEVKMESGIQRVILPPKILPPLVVKLPLVAPTIQIGGTPSATPSIQIVPQPPAQPGMNIVVPPAPVNPQPTIQLPNQPPVQPPVQPPAQPPVQPPVQPPSPLIQNCGTLAGKYNCMRFKTGCYCFVQDPASWRSALDICTAGGKSLLSIESAAKNADLLENLPNAVGINTPLAAANGFWTSGTYIAVVNKFLWASIGQYFAFTNWANGSPVTPNTPPGAGGVCVQAQMTDSVRWSDVGCNLQKPFICQ